MKKKNKSRKPVQKKRHLKLVKAPLNTKMGLWLSQDLIDRMRAHVDKNRNAPAHMTINSFVRDALEAKLPSKRRARAA